MEDVRNAKNKDDYLCYLGLHIEQGGLLEAEQRISASQSGIVAILRYKVGMAGKANLCRKAPMRAAGRRIGKSLSEHH